MNQSSTKRIVLFALFGAMLAIPFVRRKLEARKAEARTNQSAPAILSSYGFVFEEKSKEAGLDFTHAAPKLDPKLDHILPQIASMGAGVAVSDFDRDGWQDLFVVNSGEGSPCRLYRNLGNGKFEDVAAKAGLRGINDAKTGVAMGALWGDVDNDGFEDLFVYRWGRPALFRNEGGKTFTEVTDGAGFPARINANTACWLDYDRDGKLDLFVASYYRDDVDLWNLADTRIMPDSFEYATNGGRKYLFHNLGGGKFEEVAEKLGIKSSRWALSVVAADLRGTGYPDLFIANDYGYSEIFANQQGRGFKEVGQKALYYDRLKEGPKSGMNASVGDVQNTGQLAVYVSNISEEGQLIQGNNLWVHNGGRDGDVLKYENMGQAMGVDLGGWSFGAQFGDLNNDGNQDIYLVNGYVSADRSKSYWYDYSKITGANGSIIRDAKNWPRMGDQSLSGYQQKKVWINDGSGRFQEIAQIVGVKDTFDGRAVALADFDNDGTLDAVTANQKGPLLLYKSAVAPERKWVQFELEGAASNRSAIGAQVRLFWDGKQQVQEVTGGSGFCAQNMRRLHFGLGKDPKIEKVVIRWPNGKEQTLPAPEPGKIVKVKEPA
jgi:hypothetical protein